MRIVLSCSALLAVATSTSAQAQDLRAPAPRQGFYLGGGLRSGVAAAAADADAVGDFGTLTHFGGFFRFGQKPLPWLGVGLALGGGSESNDDWSVGYGGLLFELQVEPFESLDLALRGGVGVGGGSASRMDLTLETEEDPGFMFGSMYQLGVSYDWFPFYDSKAYSSGGTALTFFVEGRFFPGGDVTTGGGFIGVEITWWTGLDKRKLELPVDEAFE